MHDLDSVEQLQAALAVYRRTLAYCLHEQTKFGTRYVPPSLAQSMLEARENIRLLKARLRARDTLVTDWPIDRAPLPLDCTELADGPATSARTLPKTRPSPTSPRPSAPCDQLALDAGVPTDAMDERDQPQGVDDSSQGREAVLAPELPRVPLSKPPEDLIAVPELPGYQLLELMTQNDDVIVYRAVQRRLSRPVLVHILRVTGEIAARGLEDAWRLVMQLRHPNILPILEVGRDERLGVYLVTSSIEARSLQDELAHGPLDPLLALRVCSQIGVALDDLHAHGVVHGHLGPATVLITPQGSAYLTGLERAIALEAAHRIGSRVQEGVAVETTLISQFTSTTPGPADDLSSLGVLLDQMLYGVAPPSDQAALPRPAHETTFAGVDQMIRTLRTPEPTRRYASADQAIAALRQVFPQQLVEFADYLEASRWESTARWLENPLEAALGDVLAEAFLARCRTRANTLHRAGAIAQLLDQRRARNWLRRALPAQILQPDQIVSYNLYLYELRVHYETRAAAQSHEQVIGDGKSVPERTSPDLWAVAVPYVEPFVDVLPEQVNTAYVSTCETCRGTTEQICSACAGKGVIEQARWMAYHDGTTSAVTCRAPCLTCHTHGRLRCVRCQGAGQLRYEQTFTWSRRGRIYFNEDDLSGLPRRIVARHAQRVFRDAIDLYDPRCYENAPLQELFTAAVGGGGPDSRPVAAEFIISGVPITEVAYVAGRRLRSITLIGFDNELHAG